MDPIGSPSRNQYLRASSQDGVDYNLHVNNTDNIRGACATSGASLEPLQRRLEARPNSVDMIASWVLLVGRAAV